MNKNPAHPKLPVHQPDLTKYEGISDVRVELDTQTKRVRGVARGKAVPVFAVIVVVALVFYFACQVLAKSAEWWGVTLAVTLAVIVGIVGLGAIVFLGYITHRAPPSEK